MLLPSSDLDVIQSSGLCTEKYATKSVRHCLGTPRTKMQSMVVVFAPDCQDPDLQAGTHVLVALGKLEAKWHVQREKLGFVWK